MIKMKPITLFGFISVNILFWLIVLWVGYGFTWTFPPFDTADGSYYPSMLWGNLFNALVVYINALLLYPYRRKLWIPYWLAVVILISSNGCFILKKGGNFGQK